MTSEDTNQTAFSIDKRRVYRSVYKAGQIPMVVRPAWIGRRSSSSKPGLGGKPLQDLEQDEARENYFPPPVLAVSISQKEMEASGF